MSADHLLQIISYISLFGVMWATALGVGLSISFAQRLGSIRIGSSSESIFLNFLIRHRR